LNEETLNMQDNASKTPCKVSIEANGAATLTIDSGKINVLGSEAIAHLVETIETLGRDASVRCLTLRGNERAFVGGADIKEMAELTPETARSFISGIYTLCATVRAAPFPVIARVHGWCFGAGVELAAACDIRVGSFESFYAMPEVKIGIPSVVQATLLPALIGMGRTRWWLLTGRRIDARTAAQWGFLDEVANEADLDRTVAAVVADICECPPNAIRSQKRLCNEWEASFADAAARSSIDAFSRAYETSEPGIAMRAFIASRKPRT
jgi:enoyl-CoA hydratase